MTYLFFSKMLRGKLFDFKVYGGIVNYPKHEGRKVFYPKSLFLFFVCKTMCFYLKWCIKKKKYKVKYKISTQ